MSNVCYSSYYILLCSNMYGPCYHSKGVSYYISILASYILAQCNFSTITLPSLPCVQQCTGQCHLIVAPVSNTFPYGFIHKILSHQCINAQYYFEGLNIICVYISCTYMYTHVYLSFNGTPNVTILLALLLSVLVNS
jgi:hypothetical protein